jgi:cobalt-zinc-cadmium efflux system protein
MTTDTHDHANKHSHSHGVSADADSNRLTVALALIVGFMVVEVVVGIVVQSLGLLSDAAHS